MSMLAFNNIRVSVPTNNLKKGPWLMLWGWRILPPKIHPSWEKYIYKLHWKTSVKVLSSPSSPKKHQLYTLALLKQPNSPEIMLYGSWMVHVYMFYMWANHPPSKQLKLTLFPPPCSRTAEEPFDFVKKI